MKTKNTGILIAALLLIAAPVAAQSGKISGRVTDAATGEALPGVNVVLQGVRAGASADADGYYRILNVRPGLYTVQATFIGYALARVEGVRVHIDLTTEVDITLRQEAVGLDPLLVTAETPIIRRDISGSQQSITAEDIRAAPLQHVNKVLSTRTSVNAVSSVNDRPRIRGSSMEESKFIVDGVEQGDALSNRPYYAINPDAVEELQVLSGGFSAEYGNLRSGLVNVVTKTGGDTYSGSANVSYSPPALKHHGAMPYGHESDIVMPFLLPSAGAFTGNDFFAGWNAEAELPSRDPQHAGSPEELWALWLWRHRSQDSIDLLKELARNGSVSVDGRTIAAPVLFGPGVGDPDNLVFHETGDLPDHTAAFTLGGPLPGLDAVKFFVSYDQREIEYVSAQPPEAYLDRNARGNLTVNLTAKTRLRLHGFWSVQRGADGNQGPRATDILSSNPFNQLGGKNKFWYGHCTVPGQRNRQIYGAQLTHALNAGTFLEIDFAHHRVDHKMLLDLRETAPLPSVEGHTGLVQGRIGTDEEIARWSDSSSPDYIPGYENWRDWARIKIGDHWYDESPVAYSAAPWWVDVTGWYRMSTCSFREDASTTRGYDVKTALTSQLGRHHLVKAGVQARRESLALIYTAIDPATGGGQIEESSGAPWLLGAYLTDKLEYRGFVANVGLRLDGFVHSAFPLLDGDPTSDTDGVYSDFLLAGNAADEEGDPIVRDLLDEERAAQWRLSPRVGISHPISTTAKIFFNYGHMYQRPAMYDLYQIELIGRHNRRVGRLGNPAARPPRTIQYEVGYEHNLFDAALLRVTGYYKDINNELGDVSYFPLGQPAWRRPENLRFRDTRGIEAALDLARDVIPYLSGFASLNWMVESGGAFAFNQFYEDPVFQPRQVLEEVTSPDVRPIVRGGVTVSTPQDFGPGGERVSLLGGIDVSLIGFWQRGYRFTWNPAGLPDVLAENNARWKPYTRWDLRLTKDLFASGDTQMSFYVDVTNLFDRKYLTPAHPDLVNDENLTEREFFGWDGTRWFRNTFVRYMNSIGYAASDQNPDGTFDSSKKPGYAGSDAELPPWDSFRFLEKRDVFFGLKVYF